MNAPHQKVHLFLLLTASFGVFVSAAVLDQAVRWSDPMEGTINGLTQTVFTGFAWLFFVLPLNLGIYGLYRWRQWERHRTLAILAPAYACVLLVLAGFVFDPATPSHRLHRFTGARLPTSAHDLRTHFTGGGVADFTDIYYFRCSSAETDRLIFALGLSPTNQFDQDMFVDPLFPGWPNQATWTGRQVYRGGRDNWFYYLATDSSREQVYLIVGCT